MRNYSRTHDEARAEASANSLHRIVRRWWVVECTDKGTTYETGGHHATLKDAEWYAANCVSPKRLRSKCRIVRHEETATVETPNVEVCGGGRKTSELEQDANRRSQH